MNFIKQFSDYIKESVAPLRVYKDYNPDGKRYWKGFLSRYMNWNIRWNHNLPHNKNHDIHDKIFYRTDYNSKYVNSKVEKMIELVDDLPEVYPTGSYNVDFEISEFVLTINLDQEKKSIFIGTILSNTMIPFKQETDDIYLLEKIYFEKIS